MPPILRGLEPRDRDDLVVVYYDLYEERAAGVPIGISLLHDRPTLDAEEKWFADLYAKISAGTSVTRVVEVDGRAVGSCTVTPAGAGRSSEAGHVGVLGILIHRDHRGRGIGRALMVDTIERCRGQFEMIRLSVFSNNTPAIRLYESLGFRHWGLLPRAIRRGDAYFDSDEMVLVL